MTRDQAEQQARAWLVDNGFIFYPGVPHAGVSDDDVESLTILLLASQAACLEEAAEKLVGFKRDYYTYAESRAREDIITWLREQAQARRTG